MHKSKKLYSLIDDTTSISIVEAYNKSRTNIMAAMLDKTNKKLIITSPLSEEGKSITCANIAITFAKAGDKTLLLDCNLRSPAQQKLFKIDAKHNLVQFLNNECELKDLINHTSVANLDVIVTESLLDNPTGLLSLPNLSVLIEKLESTYDYIFIDTPSMTEVADATILARLVPNIILVVRSGLTKHKDIQECIETLKFIGAHLVGIILNDEPQKKNKHIFKRKKDNKY